MSVKRLAGMATKGPMPQGPRHGDSRQSPRSSFRTLDEAELRDSLLYLTCPLCEEVRIALSPHPNMEPIRVRERGDRCCRRSQSSHRVTTPSVGSAFGTTLPLATRAARTARNRCR